MKIRVEFEVPDDTEFIFATLDYVYHRDGKTEWDSQEKFNDSIERIRDE